MAKKKHKQLLIDMFVNRIYLYDDKLVITFNHKDGTEIITLNDIETALTDAKVGSDLVSFGVPNKEYFLTKNHDFTGFEKKLCYTKIKGGKLCRIKSCAF